MNIASRITRIGVVLLTLLGAALTPVPLLAGDHGGGGGPEPMVFTVNLGAENYLQFGLILEPAQPEAAHLLAEYKPKIQHEIILLMATKDAAKMRTLEGKKGLIEEILELANHVIHEDEKTGVKEVLFTRFLIQ